MVTRRSQELDQDTPNRQTAAELSALHVAGQIPKVPPLYVISKRHSIATLRKVMRPYDWRKLEEECWLLCKCYAPGGFIRLLSEVTNDQGPLRQEEFSFCS